MPLEESRQFLFFSIALQNAREAISNAGPYFIFRLFQLQTSPIRCKLSEKSPLETAPCKKERSKHPNVLMVPLNITTRIQLDRIT